MRREENSISISSGAQEERESKENSPGHLTEGGYYIASQAERERDEASAANLNDDFPGRGYP